MENKKALQLIDKILADLNRSGIITNTLIEDLKELRTYAIEEQIPLAVKVLRYAYEHIEENDSFLIPIPEDEPIQEEGDGEDKEQTDNTTGSQDALDPVESLSYMVSLFKDLTNKMNVADLKEYRDALNA
ncbi:hypothetical protein [Aquimarina intermedia]|uniref:Uncharacterized protein n=1 Tax=Aquimarina intermedia TaxID=350814 RepID=A0A5S5CB30_9FLAO|nr:hypothetical protein [Aquimarina intermedia]TYP75193.1 hypothetical protein BD809_103257 [Aquimarina intermedia]